ncbi:MAG: M20/M25/M40 family metallo-hydrolase [Candidatus Helarchaeota archaeon]
MPLKAGKEYDDYMFNFIDSICKNIGPRLATKPEEHKCIKFIGEELDKTCDETFTQEFKTSFLAYPRGLLRWGGGLCMIGFFFLFTIIPWLCAVICITGLFLAITELLFLKEYLDIFYKKGISKNIFGRIKPKSGEPKKYLIFGGHSDSAFELPFAKLGVDAMQRRMFGAIGLGIFAILWSIIKTIVPCAFSCLVIHPFFSLNWLDIGFLCVFFPWFAFFLYIYFGFFGSELVEGANDNLSGCAVACAIAKYFKDHEEERPNNVEIICGSFGAEEVGQRGSKAFIKQIPEEILDNSYTVVLESVGGGEGVGILKAETMYLTTSRKFPFIHPIMHHPDVYNRVHEAYLKCKEKKKGLPPVQLAEAKFAGTDAMRFSEKNVPACAIVAGLITTFFLKNWHSPEDTPENLNKHIMNFVLNISLEFIDLVDKEYEK